MELEKIASDENAETGVPQTIGKKKGYPKHVFFIIGNEFCERFSYYGMRTVLVLYARNFLLFDDDTSTSIFHAFTLLAYLTPLLGGILADSYWGKYKTIAYLSIVYVLGHALKTVAAIPYIESRATHITLSMAGLAFIALGTGGIKPCVSSFGGDQFSADQGKYISQFFAIFYFSINAGALLSKWITPTFRADLKCYPGHDGRLYQECYSVAFGVPGLLMLVAFVLFLAGTKYYTRYAPEGSIFWKFCKCAFSACKNRWTSRNDGQPAKSHWVQYADASKKLKRDTKYVVRILYLFLPLPFFWALFDQQGSRWTLQALQLDGYWGDYIVKPDQIDVINPLLIVTLIPLFEVTLYPLLRRYKINFSPIRRMTAGLVLAGLSFICAAVLQFEIDKGLTPLPASNEFSVRIINAAPCNIHFTSSSSAFDNLVLNSNTLSATKSTFMPETKALNLSYRSCDNSSSISVDVFGKGGEIIDVILSGSIADRHVQKPMPTQKLENGMSIVTFVNTDPNTKYLVKILDSELEVLPGQRSNNSAVRKGGTKYTVLSSDGKSLYNGTLSTNPGGVYSVILTQINSTVVEANKFADGSRQLVDINPNTINIAWMIPQYFIITTGEVFLSITGLEFSYTQAPPSMKSVVTSGWLLTVSMGNVIVLLIAKTHAIERQAHEFLLFAGLIGVAAVIFSIMARGYVLVDQKEFMEVENGKEEDGTPLVNGAENEA